MIESKKELVLGGVEDKLNGLLQSQADAMPKGFNETRFLQNCLAVLNDTNDIEKCDPTSIARCLIKGAYLDLDFFRKECYAIAYGGIINFQTDYKGERKVCMRWSARKLKDIYAKVVREGDQFDARVEEGKQIVNFKPLNFNNGKVIGVFSIIYFEDGTMSYESMSVAEADRIKEIYSRKTVKGQYSPAYRNTPDEMRKKIVMRRHMKSIDIVFDNEQQSNAFAEGSIIDKEKLSAEDADFTDVGNPYEEKKEAIEDVFGKSPSQVKEGPNGEVIG